MLHFPTYKSLISHSFIVSPLSLCSACIIFLDTDVFAHFTVQVACFPGVIEICLLSQPPAANPVLRLLCSLLCSYAFVYFYIFISRRISIAVGGKHHSAIF